MLGLYNARLGKSDEADGRHLYTARLVRRRNVELNDLFACDLARVANIDFYHVLGAVAHYVLARPRTRLDFPLEIGIRKTVAERILHDFIVGSALSGKIPRNVGGFVPLVADVNPFLIDHAVVGIRRVHERRVMRLVIVSERIRYPARRTDVAAEDARYSARARLTGNADVQRGFDALVFVEEAHFGIVANVEQHNDVEAFVLERIEHRLFVGVELEIRAVVVAADLEQLVRACVFAGEPAEHDDGGMRIRIRFVEPVLRIEARGRIEHRRDRIGTAAFIGVDVRQPAVIPEELFIVLHALFFERLGERHLVILVDDRAAAAAAGYQKALVGSRPAEKIYLVRLVERQKAVLVFEQDHTVLAQLLHDLIALLERRRSARIVGVVAREKRVQYR